MNLEKKSYALTEPNSHFDWNYIITIAREHKREMIFAHIIAIFATLCSVPLPLFMPLLVDEVLLNQPHTVVTIINSMTPQQWHGPSLYIFSVLLLTLVLRLISLILGVWQSRQFTLVAKDVIYRMRKQLLFKLERVSMAEYETLGSGIVSSYFINDLDTVDQFIGTTVSKLLIAILTIIGVAIILLWMHWQLGLLLLFANPLVIYFTTVLGKHVKELKKNENAAFSCFQQSLIETLESIQQIRASNRERHYLLQIVNNAKEVKTHTSSFAWKSDAANRLSFVIFLFGFDVFRAVAMMMVVFSDLSIGEMFAVFGYLWFMMAPVQELLNIQYAYFAAKAALKRVNTLSDLKQEPKYAHSKNPFLKKQTLGIRIENLRFSYGDQPNVLNGINLSIEEGKKVALVGASGGGKSTLVSILIGLYPIKSGMVYYGDTPVNKMGLDVVRENVATVLQNPALFNDTVRMNLTLGRDLPDNALWKALEIAQLKHIVNELPQRLDSIVGRQGIRFSGGQRQRLAIARMVLSNPSIVILDEATSALDAETEFHLHAALNEFLNDRTTLIVAHRLSAIKQANEVYVFEAGTISEQGSHKELLKQDGLYSRLYGVHQSFV